MGRRFKELKDQRGQVTAEMSQAMAKMNRDPFDCVEGYHALPCALGALRQTDGADWKVKIKLADKIEGCRHRALCQNPYCTRCRLEFVSAVKNKMMKRISVDDAVYEILAGKDADFDDED